MLCSHIFLPVFWFDIDCTEKSRFMLHCIMTNFSAGHFLKPLAKNITERTLKFGQYCLRLKSLNVWGSCCSKQRISECKISYVWQEVAKCHDTSDWITHCWSVRRAQFRNHVSHLLRGRAEPPRLHARVTYWSSKWLQMTTLKIKQ